MPHQWARKIDLTSDPVTGCFNAPADSVFYYAEANPGSTSVEYLNTNIESIVQWPIGITSLNDCFKKCTGLTSVVIPDTVISLSGSFLGCTGLTSIDLPASLTSLGNYCFSGCRKLTSINLPASLTSLGELCFWNCTSLTSITFNGTTRPTFGRDIFENVSNSLVVHVPSNYNDTTFGGRTVTKDLPAVS